MRAVLQRVTAAKVTVDGAVIGEITEGLLVLLGVGPEDSEEDVDWLCQKLAELRIFPDAEGRMNRSVTDIEGELLVVSQFTLFGDCRKGRRPSFAGAAPPEKAERLYEQVVATLRRRGLGVATGKFAAKMAVSLTNDGPVTLWIDSADRSRPKKGS